MGLLIDLTGQIFGRWTVTERSPNRGRETMWLSRCECGTERAIRAGKLVSGRSKSCGCAQLAAHQRALLQFVDLTGNIFGDWTVIERVENANRNPMWSCRCKCGNEKYVSGSNLRSGNSTCCKACQTSRCVIDLTGQIFGDLTVIERRENTKLGGTRWLCRCSCGKERIVPSGSLRSGHTKSCGHGQGNGYISNGYRIIRMTDHPNARKNGWLPEHTVVMSRELRRPLLPGENVHHKNGIRDDNRPENLELWYTSQPKGARVEDLIGYIAKYHLAAVIKRASECSFIAEDPYHLETDQAVLARAK